jgi:hypothetical protein
VPQNLLRSKGRKGKTTEGRLKTTKCASLSDDAEKPQNKPKEKLNMELTKTKQLNKITALCRD